jgi:hypothetical protein
VIPDISLNGAARDTPASMVDPLAGAAGLSQVRPGRTCQNIFWNRFLMSAALQPSNARPDFLQKS